MRLKLVCVNTSPQGPKTGSSYTSVSRRHLPSKWYIISTPAQFSYTFDGTGADGARSEDGKRILRDNSRVYVRFLSFVGGRVHPGRLGDYELC